jgi:hypothetical protein
MTNPTSNFGWQMPTPTDLVTDLPADFEVFGQAVDTSLADLKGGTTGQFLKKNSNTDMDFVWSGGGKLLQVVNAIYTTTTSTSSSTYADTGLTATITPTSATSKVLVFVTIPVYKDTNNTAGQFKVFRAATEIATLNNAGANGATTGIDVGAVAINYLDSPATTSATIYKVQFASASNNARVIINDIRISGVVNSSSITLMEIGA